MKDRQVEILQCLLKEDEPVSIKDLMTRFSKGERSIRYDLLEIRKELAAYGIEINSSRGNGYYIEPVQKAECESILKAGTLTDRTRDNIDLAIGVFCILYRQKDPISLDEMAERIGCSKGPLNKALKDFNLHQKNVSLVPGRRGIRLYGDEFAIRRLASEYVNELLQQDDHMVARREFIQETIRKTNEKFDVWMSTVGFQELTIYCEITDIRVNPVDIQADDRKISEEENAYTLALLNPLKRTSRKEQLLLLHQLDLSRIVIPRRTQAQEDADKQINLLIQRISRECSKAGIWLNLTDLSHDLKQHLNQLVKSLENHITLPENPLLLSVKNTYRSSYEIASKAADGIHLYKDYKLDDSEISYIAIYIYLNSRKQWEKRKRALVVCATGKGLSNMIAAKIRDRIPAVEIVGVQSAYHDIQNAEDVDFIISTIPLPESKLPVIVVSPMVTNTELATISGFVHEGMLPVNNSKDEMEVTKNERLQLRTAAENIDTVLMDMIDTVNSLPSEFAVTSEILSALMMHLLLAVPRWCSEEVPTDEKNAEQRLKAVHEKYPQFASQMDAFFKRTENTLGLKLYEGEKLAFCLYILKEV